MERHPITQTAELEASTLVEDLQQRFDNLAPGQTIVISAFNQEAQTKIKDIPLEHFGNEQPALLVRTYFWKRNRIVEGPSYLPVAFEAEEMFYDSVEGEYVFCRRSPNPNTSWAADELCVRFEHLEFLSIEAEANHNNLEC